MSLLIEAEQNGDNRAEYGKYIIRNLSSYLTEHYGKRYSVDNLKLMRRFYTIYKTDSIGETVFPQFKNYPVTATGRKFYLSWSHYLERHFYEIESVKNDWSLSELKRQYDSSLYERLALNKNKDEVILLSEKGQIIEKPAYAIKDPYVLELPVYSEIELENKII